MTRQSGVTESYSDEPKPKPYPPACETTAPEPYERLAAAVIIQAVQELSGPEPLPALDAAAWLLDGQSSAQLFFAVANLGEPRQMLSKMAPNFSKRPNRPRKGKIS